MVILNPGVLLQATSTGESSGMTTLIMAAVMLGALVLFLLFRRRSSGSAEPVHAVEQTSASSAAAVYETPGPDPRTLAVISAAVFAVVGRRGRIRRIVTMNQSGSSAWAGAGRASVQSSHNIRRSI